MVLYMAEDANKWGKDFAYFSHVIYGLSSHSDSTLLYVALEIPSQSWSDWFLPFPLMHKTKMIVFFQCKVDPESSNYLSCSANTWSARGTQ